MSERLEEIINDLPYSIRYLGELEVLIEYTRGQSVQVDKFSGKMAELNQFIQRFADEKGWGKNVVDIAIQIIEEQAERVQELEKEFELCDSTMHLIDMTINNPSTSDDDKWEKVNKTIKKYYADDCIHCNGKGFNGLDYCLQCSKGIIMELEQQNKRYREALLNCNNELKQLFEDIPNFNESSKGQGIRRKLVEISSSIQETLEVSE